LFISHNLIFRVVIEVTVSRDEYFFMTYTFDSVLYVPAPLVLKPLGCLVGEKNKFKDFASFSENLINLIRVYKEGFWKDF
jgi:hypothetical protein